jgi:hypothetical protein
MQHLDPASVRSRKHPSRWPSHLFILVSECLVVITTIVLGVAVFDLVTVVASEVHMSDLGHVGVMFNLEIAIPALRTDEG